MCWFRVLCSFSVRAGHLPTFWLLPRLRSGSNLNTRHNPWSFYTLGALFWGPYKRDPLILGPECVPLIFGNACLNSRRLARIPSRGRLFRLMCNYRVLQFSLHVHVPDCKDPQGPSTEKSEDTLPGLAMYFWALKQYGDQKALYSKATKELHSKV